MSELQEFLGDEAGKGRLHSRGVFTIDLARSKLKLFRSQHADPAMFLVQLVQAAVRSGCQEIRFFESRGRFFEGPAGLEMFCRSDHDKAFPLETLRQEILSDPLSLQDTALRDLISGLGSALALVEGVGIGYRGEEPWHILEHPRLKSRSKGNGYVFLFDALFSDGRECRIIRERCFLSPVPIFWNNSLLAKQAEIWSSQRRLLEVLHLGRGLGVCLQALPRVGTSTQRAPLNPPRKLYCRISVDANHTPQLRNADSIGAVIACSRAVSIPVVLDGESRLTFVRHGVALDSVTLHSDFGCQVFLNGDSQSVDLSQLRVREGVALEKARLEALQEMVEAARAALQRLPLEPMLEPSSGGTPNSLRVGCGLLGLLALLVHPVLGIAMISSALRSDSSATMEDPKALEEANLVRLTRARLHQLTQIPLPPLPTGPPPPPNQKPKPFLTRPPRPA